MSRTDTFEETRGVAAKIGGWIETPRGPVEAVDAPGISTLLVHNPKDPTQSRVGILLYDPEHKMGMVAQVDADTARTFAASFLRLAEQLDPRTNH